MRDMEALTAAHGIGIDRMVVGSAAVFNPELIPAAVAEFGGAIVVGLDARNGKVATRGWIEQTSIDVSDIAQRVADEGVQHIAFTDIGRDGRLEGPNLDALQALVDHQLASIIASGGVGSLDDITNVARIGAAGVIVGAALYHQKFTLAEALATARNTQEVHQ